MLQPEFRLGKDELGEVPGCGAIQRYSYDIFVDYPFSLLIELDGGQHFKPVVFGHSTWAQAVQSFRHGVQRDRWKDAYAARRRIPLLRVGPDTRLIEPMLQANVQSVAVQEMVASECWLKTRFSPGCVLLQPENMEQLLATMPAHAASLSDDGSFEEQPGGLMLQQVSARQL